MGASGSVSYLFDNKGVIVFAGDDADAIFELLLEADVDGQMMSKQKKERSQSTLHQLIFTKQSLLCVNQVSKNSK